jgi:hypothetical protein
MHSSLLDTLPCLWILFVFNGDSHGGYTIQHRNLLLCLLYWTRCLHRLKNKTLYISDTSKRCPCSASRCPHGCSRRPPDAAPFQRTPGVNLSCPCRGLRQRRGCPSEVVSVSHRGLTAPTGRPPAARAARRWSLTPYRGPSRIPPVTIDLIRAPTSAQRRSREAAVALRGWSWRRRLSSNYELRRTTRISDIVSRN